jgi:hypothetical protein
MPSEGLRSLKRPYVSFIAVIDLMYKCKTTPYPAISLGLNHAAPLIGKDRSDLRPGLRPFHASNANRAEHSKRIEGGSGTGVAVLGSKTTCIE